MSSLLGSAFKLAYELSPIILVNGIAKNIPGQALPIVAITEAVNFVGGLLTGSNVDFDNFFAHFQPLSGATLIDQQVATYPFANQTTAANATITQPLRTSLLMVCPVRDEFGYLVKLATMTALQKTLAYHNQLGGYYTVITPSYFYTNCLLERVTDVSTGETQQSQVSWRFDFMQPLLTLQQAQTALNNQMQKIEDASQISGNPSFSGFSPAVGGSTPPLAPSIIPSASGLPAAGVSSPAQ